MCNLGDKNGLGTQLGWKGKEPGMTTDLKCGNMVEKRPLGSLRRTWKNNFNMIVKDGF
jgi:hypothetical protein